MENEKHEASESKAYEKKEEMASKLLSGKFRPMMTPEQAKKLKAEEKKKSSMVESIDGLYYYPESIRFNARQLPEIKTWEVGKEYELAVKVKMAGYEQRKSEKGTAKEEGRFEILGVKNLSK